MTAPDFTPTEREAGDVGEVARFDDRIREALWRAGLRPRHAADLAAALAPLIAERERAAGARALREFVQWVATQRAYNGSDYRHGQSLYNECVNAALPEWAEEWLALAPENAQDAS